MKQASITKSKLPALVQASESEPVVLTRNRRPVAVIVRIQDQDELEHVLMAHSPRLRAIIEQSRRQVREGKVLSHDEFWREVGAMRVSKRAGRKRKAG